MKKFLFVFFILFFAIDCFSQSVADLERDPSFKGITIGCDDARYVGC